MMYRFITVHRDYYNLLKPVTKSSGRGKKMDNNQYPYGEPITMFTRRESAPPLKEKRCDACLGAQGQVKYDVLRLVKTSGAPYWVTDNLCADCIERLFPNYNEANI